MKRALRVLLGLALTFAVMFAVSLFVLSTSTRFSSHDLSFMGRTGDPVPPKWTQPCWRYKGHPYVLPCGRVEGEIVFRERRDSDGDGDVHGLAVAGRRLVILKANPSLRTSKRIPGVGRRVDLAGVTLPGRFGLTVVDVRRVNSPPDGAVPPASAPPGRSDR